MLSAAKDWMAYLNKEYIYFYTEGTDYAL